MPASTLFNVFGIDSDSDLHRCTTGIIDRCRKRDQLADVDDVAEDDTVDRQRHHVFSGVAARAGERDLVEQFQQRATMDVSAKVSHVRRH